MKKNFKEKLNNFWEKNKYKIIGISCLLGIGIAVAAKCRNAGQGREETNEPEPEYEPRHEDDFPTTIIERSAHPDQTFEEKMNDPDRKLDCGGWVLEDDMRNPELPLLLANDVPISALGEFGQELVKKAEGADLGRFNQDLQKAWCSIMVNFETPEAQEGTTEEKEETAA